MYIFCNYPFELKVSIIQSFQGSNFLQFCILSMLHMYKKNPEATLSVNFGLFGDNFVTSSI